MLVHCCSFLNAEPIGLVWFLVTATQAWAFMGFLPKPMKLPRTMTGTGRFSQMSRCTYLLCSLIKSTISKAPSSEGWKPPSRTLSQEGSRARSGVCHMLVPGLCAASVPVWLYPRTRGHVCMVWAFWWQVQLNGNRGPYVSKIYSWHISTFLKLLFYRHFIEKWLNFNH